MTGLKARFERKVAKSGDCWEWQASRFHDGYGRLQVNRKSMRAHRLAYEIYVGAIPSGMSVCHRCDNPGCVNPAHLFLGSHADNMRDRGTKGRASGGMLRGEKSPASVLTEQQAKQIREMALLRVAPQAVIAEQFGISQSQVSEIKNGRYW